MASLNSWLSPGIMRAIGWALIHSLWQCLAIAALAAVAMAFSRRPALRYAIAVGALAVMLTAPLITFLLLVKPPAIQTIAVQAIAQPVGVVPAIISSPGARLVTAIQDTPRLVSAQSFLPWLVAAWLAGVAFFSLRFAGGFLLLERKRRQSFAPEAHILALCHQVQSQLGLSRAVRYLECNWLQAPAVIGWLRPIVLIPVTALTGLSEAQLRAVIAHELAHIRRFDVFVNLFQIFAETLLFYHPALWWLNRRIRGERELCCDEIALSVTGDRLDYAKALTVMAQWEAPPRLAMAANAGVLSARVFHILGRPSSNRGQRVIGVTGSVLFLAAALSAANALFVVAAPPIVQAGERLTRTVGAALSSVQTAGENFKQQVFSPPARIGPVKTEMAPDRQSDRLEKLAPPAGDLSGLLPMEKLQTPTIVASPAPQTVQPPQTAPGNPAAGPHDAMHRCSNRNAYGIVISPKAIQLPGFSCFIGGDQANSLHMDYGSCPLASAYYPIPRRCRYDLVLNVRLADPGDTHLMVPGKLVRLAGRFRVTIENRLTYLTVSDARLVWADPFERLAKIEPARSAAKPAPPAASANPAPPTAVAPAAPKEPPGVTAVQVSSSPPQVEMSPVHFCRNRSVFGQVTAANTVALQGFTCFAGGDPTDTISPRDISLGACPLASSTTSYKIKCKFDVVLNVRLANPADSAKMIPGKLVRLGGDFRTWKEDKLDYVGVTNAKVLFTDYYWTAGASNLPMPLGMPNFSDTTMQVGPFVQTQPTSYPPSNPAPQNQ